MYTYTGVRELVKYEFRWGKIDTKPTHNVIFFANTGMRIMKYELGSFAKEDPLNEE
jgi:hypothetical protein